MSHWVLPSINLVQCSRCGACIEACPESAVEMRSEGPFFARPGDCTYCAECEEACPQGAISCAFEIVWGTQAVASGATMNAQTEEV